MCKWMYLHLRFFELSLLFKPRIVAHVFSPNLRSVKNAVKQLCIVVAICTHNIQYSKPLSFVTTVSNIDLLS